MRLALISLLMIPLAVGCLYDKSKDDTSTDEVVEADDSAQADRDADTGEPRGVEHR